MLCRADCAGRKQAPSSPHAVRLTSSLALPPVVSQMSSAAEWGDVCQTYIQNSLRVCLKQGGAVKNRTPTAYRLFTLIVLTVFNCTHPHDCKTSIIDISSSRSSDTVFRMDGVGRWVSLVSVRKREDVYRIRGGPILFPNPGHLP